MSVSEEESQQETPVETPNKTAGKLTQIYTLSNMKFIHGGYAFSFAL